VGDTFVVLDAFALPVEGTETRVNAQAEAYEYMVDFVQASRDHGRREHVVGWYHSHPGYGCWMSGIDCSTQLLNQQYTEPFLAIVIDPVRTCAAGKVEIGAFRTYPQGYKGATGGDPENGGGAGGGGGGGGGYQTIPMDKIEDFGVHANQYYRLDVSFFKSRLDAEMLDVLWNKYWVNTLSSSPARANRAFVATQIEDLARKMTHAESHPGGTTAGRGGMGGLFIRGGGAGAARRAMEENALGKIAADGAKVTIEHAKGAATQAIKDAVFNRENGLRRVKVPTNEADDADRGGDVVMT
jgi:COP9 signalosome complex subunit 5